MSIIRWVSRAIHWYTKDGLGRLFGKILGSFLTGVIAIDTIFDTNFLGLVAIGVLVLVILFFKFGSLILKGLDMAGFVDIGAEGEVIRKGFGLVTGIGDWFELLTGLIRD